MQMIPWSPQVPIAHLLPYVRSSRQLMADVLASGRMTESKSCPRPGNMLHISTLCIGRAMPSLPHTATSFRKSLP